MLSGDSEECSGEDSQKALRILSGSSQDTFMSFSGGSGSSQETLHRRISPLVWYEVSDDCLLSEPNVQKTCRHPTASNTQA